MVNVWSKCMVTRGVRVRVMVMVRVRVGAAP